MITNVYDQLRRDEGVRRFPYTDTAGKITIGIGRNLTDKGLSGEEIAGMLQNDVAEVDKALEVLPWYAGLSDARKGVLVNMGFNLGVHGLLAFHDTLGHMSRGEWDQAAVAMLDSNWALQVGDRAKRLAEQVRTDAWQ